LKEEFQWQQEVMSLFAISVGGLAGAVGGARGVFLETADFSGGLFKGGLSFLPF
jgi:hypothetical protein